MDFHVDAVEMQQDTAKVLATFQVLSHWHVISQAVIQKCSGDARKGSSLQSREAVCS